MFKIAQLSFTHPFLGKLNFNFVPDKEKDNGPYTTILIGKNGTGKSIILRTIADIFEDLNAHFQSIPKYRNKVNFTYNGKVHINNKSIIFTYAPEDDGETKLSLKFKLDSGEESQESISPSQLAVSAYLVSDKFRFANKDKRDFYVYLGLRERANYAGTKSYLNRIIPYTINYIKDDNSKLALKRCLEFLEFKSDYMEVQYECRYKPHFFTGTLTSHKLEDLLSNWKKFSKRQSQPRYLDYFAKNIQGNEKLLTDLANFMNNLTNVFDLKRRGKSHIRINILVDNILNIEFIRILNRLDLLSTPNIFLSKKGTSLNIEQTSSGEFHYLTSILGLLTNITPGSLILIDEPEISFHPNWQLKYIYFLKKIFSEYKSSHFIIATHSHFMVSDLEPDSSNVIQLVRDEDNKLNANSIKENTYNMSAEEILYRVFELRTFRNYYFEIELRELLHLISNKSSDKERINELINNLSKVKYDKNDPITKIISEAHEYSSRL